MIETLPRDQQLRDRIRESKYELKKLKENVERLEALLDRDHQELRKIVHEALVQRDLKKIEEAAK